MAVIIRLQNLPLAADSLDIREFFKGLKIPEGGVHIVGGELGDAFIGFATDEDARQAMNMSNHKIKDVPIKLLLSSKTEMQNIILAARERQAKLMAAMSQQSLTHKVVTTNDKASLVSSNLDNSSVRANVTIPYKRDRSQTRSPEPNKRVIQEYTKSPSRITVSPQAYVTSTASNPKTEYIAQNLNDAAGQQISNTPNLNGYSADNTIGVNNYNLNNNTDSYQLQNGNMFNPLGNMSMAPTIPAAMNFTVPLLNNFLSNTLMPNNFLNPLLAAANINNTLSTYMQQTPTFYYAMARNFPERANMLDILQFFSECYLEPSSIIYLKDRNGYKNGKILIRFTNEKHYQTAFNYNGKRFLDSKNRIDVFKSDSKAWEEAHNDTFPVDSRIGYDSKTYQNNQQISNEPEFCIRIKNLSFKATTNDIQSFFGFPITNIHLECNEQNKSMGTAYVEFTNVADYKKALDMHRSVLFDRYIVIDPIKKSDVIRLVQQNIQLINNNKFANNNDSRKVITAGDNKLAAIHVNGIPQTVRINDIINHLSTKNFKPKEIHILRKNGQPAGECFIEFFNANEAYQAISVLNGTILHGSMIRVVPAFALTEIAEYLNKYDPINWLSKENLTNYDQQNLISIDKSPYSTPTENAYLNANGQNLINGVIPNNNNNDGTNNVLLNTNTNANFAPPFGIQPNNFPNQVASHIQPTMNANSTRMRYPSGNSRFPQPQSGVPPFLSNGSMFSGMPRKSTIGISQRNPPRSAHVARLKITNLPDGVSADEIIKLFKPHHCLAQTIQMPHDKSGKSLNEAILSFPNTSLAQKALTAFHGYLLKDKKIEVNFYA